MELSVFLVCVFCLLNYVEILNLNQLFFLTYIRLAIQLFFGLLFVYSFIRDLIVRKKVDYILLISLLIGVYLFSIGMINYRTGFTSLKTMLSTTVWVPLFFGFLISRIRNKYLDFTIVTLLFVFFAFAFLVLSLLANYYFNIHSTPAKNSIYYACFACFGLLFSKNKFISLGGIVTAAVITLVFGKITFFVAIVAAIFIYLLLVIDEKNSKVFIGVLIALTSIIVIGFIVFIVWILIDNSIVNVINNFSTGRLEIFMKTLKRFFEGNILNIVFGNGYDSVNGILGISAHNDYIEILFDYGFVGLIGYLFLIVYAVIRAYKISNPFYKKATISFIALCVVFSFASHLVFILKYSLIAFVIISIFMAKVPPLKRFKKENAKKIMWIMPANLPVPATKGGAIEGLLQLLLDENEKRGQFEFVVMSPYDEDAFKRSRDYKHSTFYYFKTGILDKILDFVFRVLYKISFSLIPKYSTRIGFYEGIRSEEQPDITILDGDYTQITAIEKQEPTILYLHILPLMLKKQRGNSIIAKNDETWVISDFVKKEMEKYIKPNHHDKIQIIKNAVNLNLFKQDDDGRTQIREKFGYTKKDRVILFCGRLVEDKGILDLVNAMDGLPDNAKLLVVGSPNFADKTKSIFVNELKQKTEANPNINFSGYVNHEELYKYYSASDIVCTPSKCKEAACLVNLEAMACGKPIITSSDGGIPEYVKDSAIIIDEENRVQSIHKNILNLLKNKDFLSTYSEKAYNTSKEYGVNQYYDSFEKMINDMQSCREE